KGELADVGGLADKGLVVNTRVSGLERSVAEIESRLLDIGTSSLRAKQDINKATQDEVNLRNDRTAEIAAELQSVDADLEAANLKIAMYSNLMAEALSISPDAGAGADAPPPQFVILRSLDGEPKEIEADETTPVLPGDVVKVKILPPPSQ
ncbi:sugar ABC transporter substrate-binding protein, partial [Rhizobiaceae sp. 2RAB30]